VRDHPQITLYPLFSASLIKHSEGCVSDLAKGFPRYLSPESPVHDWKRIDALSWPSRCRAPHARCCTKASNLSVG